MLPEKTISTASENWRPKTPINTQVLTDWTSFGDNVSLIRFALSRAYALSLHLHDDHVGSLVVCTLISAFISVGHLVLDYNGI